MVLYGSVSCRECCHHRRGSKEEGGNLGAQRRRDLAGADDRAGRIRPRNRGSISHSHDPEVSLSESEGVRCINCHGLVNETQGARRQESQRQ